MVSALLMFILDMISMDILWRTPTFVRSTLSTPVFFSLLPWSCNGHADLDTRIKKEQ
jgi:hypothetical protein